jgi:NADH-quinone oxidoreductase subunit L
VNPGIPAAFVERSASCTRFLLNKWYFDELYDFLFVRPALPRPVFWKATRPIIDGFGPNGAAWVVARAAAGAQAPVRIPHQLCAVDAGRPCGCGQLGVD